MSHTNTSALLNPFGIIITGKLKWVSIILACLIVLNLNSTIKPVKSVTESETKWVLDRVIVGEGSEVVVPDGDRFEGSFDKYTVSSTSITHHSRAMDHWGADDFVNAVFEFSLPVFPAELVPGQTVEVSASGSGSGYMRAGYFVRTLEFRSDDVGLTGKLSSGEEVHGQFGPYVTIDIDTQAWTGDSWATTVTDVPASDTVTLQFVAPSCFWDNSEFSVIVFLWNGPYAGVEWVYRCEETGEEVSEEDPETIEPSFEVEPDWGYPTDELVCTGTGFQANVKGGIIWSEEAFWRRWDVETDGNGAFTKTIKIPPKASKGESLVIADFDTGQLADTVIVKYRPIVFIPGVGGSQLASSGYGVWPTSPTGSRNDLLLDETGSSDIQIDAPDIIRYVGDFEITLTDVYGSFIPTLVSWGYKENEDLFVFPYDWRQDNYKHVEALDIKINNALSATEQEKVVLVAHSMGGIVARAYMDRKGTGKVHSFITMGTPHQGSVKPFYAFTSGYTFGNKFVHKKLMQLILRNCPSGYQLLPWKPFITGPDGVWSLEDSFSISFHEPRYEGYTTHYGIPTTVYSTSEDWPMNLNEDMVQDLLEFREDLGTTAPSGIKTYTIIGYGSATLNSYNAREVTESGSTKGIIKADGSQWVLEPDMYSGFTDGDGTVPLWSAEGISNDIKLYVKNLPEDSATHGALPACERVQMLLKDIIFKESDNSTQYQWSYVSSLIDEEKANFEIHSSARLHIYDSQGNHLGVNEYGAIDEDIPSGSFIEIDGHEFSSILEIGDSYDVEVIGFEEGNFTLNMVITSEGETVDYSYPEIDVVNGSIASFTLPDSQSVKDDPPEITVQIEDTVLTFLPEVVEEQKLAEDTTIGAEDADNDAIGGIPGFPITSILIGTIIIAYLYRKRILISYSRNPFINFFSNMFR